MISQGQTAKPVGMSKFLEGFVIFFSGVEEARKTKAKEIVVLFGGKCADKFSGSVTCGVVERVGSSGYKDLLASKIQMVSMRWLLDCRASRTLAPMEAAQYKITPFLGLVIVCTQVSIDERNRVQELVVKHGGVFSERFVGNQCTHLIAKTPTGDKYFAAKKCGNVNIVTNNWVEECSKQNVWVPEIGYSVDLLFRRALKLQQEAKDSEKVTSVESASTKRSTPSKALHLVEELEHFLTKEAGVTSLPYYQAMWTLKSTVFDGMVFWIKGYDQEVTDYLTSCVLAGGGLRSMVLHDGVTTALLGEEATSSDYSVARRHPCGLDFVNLVWVVEQLLSFGAIRNLIADKEPFADLLNYAERSHFQVRSVEELCALNASSRMEEERRESPNESKKLRAVP